MNYKKNIRYFKKRSMGPYLGIVFGILLLIIGAANSISAVIWISILLLGVCGACIFLNWKLTPSDEEYDTAIKNEIENLRGKALTKLGVDEDEVKEIDPIVIEGFDYDNFTFSKHGGDSRWRTNKYKAIYFFFSENEVHSYTYEFFTTEDRKTESTDVYFYKDIVSVSTASTTTKLATADISYEYFKLITKGGTSLSVSLHDSGRVQKSINAMRQLLKAKKV